MLAGVTDPVYQGETGLQLPNRCKEQCIWNIGNLLGHLLVLPCTVMKVNGKLQQPNLCRTSNGPDASGMKV